MHDDCNSAAFRGSFTFNSVSFTFLFCFYLFIFDNVRDTFVSRFLADDKVFYKILFLFFFLSKDKVVLTDDLYKALT